MVWYEPKTGTVMFLYRSSAFKMSLCELQNAEDASDPTTYVTSVPNMVKLNTGPYFSKFSKRKSTGLHIHIYIYK